jgi:spermidine/putrescine transport system ATP-binding protein
MSAEVELKNVSVTFGSFYAAKNVNVKVEGGEFFSFLGPSGCGKTTLLRAISGFQDPSEGEVLIDNKNMLGIGPNKRPTSLIFQNLALFPLMSVADNIAFSLEVKGVSRKNRRKRADELLELIALEGQGDKKVHQLSGGQKQRVAIARALAIEPKVLLLDEPLSALDLKLRQRMRTELREIQKRVNITFIYITHDQGEALTMSDRIAVMNEGEIEQIGLCDEVYNNPSTPFVATFVGENNPLFGKIKNISQDMANIETPDGEFVSSISANCGLKIGDEAISFVRPESLIILNAGKNFDNSINAKVESFEFEGHLKNFYATSRSGTKIKFSVPNAIDTTGISTGEEISLGFDSSKSIILPKAELAID